MTLDNHYVRGGQGEMVAAAIAALGLEPAVTVSAIGVTELPECGTNDEVLALSRPRRPVACQDLSSGGRRAAASRRVAVA